MGKLFSSIIKEFNVPHVHKDRGMNYANECLDKLKIEHEKKEWTRVTSLPDLGEGKEEKFTIIPKKSTTRIQESMVKMQILNEPNF